jgi:hypothetical protein
MLIKSRQFRLSIGGPSPGAPAQGLMGRILTGVIGAAVLVGAFVASVFVFAVAAGGMLLLGGYLWWTTRALRRQLRAVTQKGQVIEGEVIHHSTLHSR